MTSANIFPPQELASLLPIETAVDSWRKCLRGRAPDCFGIYVHIPFCQAKCTYCFCGSWQAQTREIENYCDNLVREMEAFSCVLGAIPVRSLYFGGGTPSILPEKQLEALITGIYERFDLTRLEQFNFEAMPQNLTESKLSILKRFGVNRLTLGIQTLSPAVLKIIGRKQTRRQVEMVIRWIRKAGIRDFNVDFVAGLPGETFESFARNLLFVLKHRPEMVHINAFQNREDTRYYKSGGKYTEEDRALSARMINASRVMVEKLGYRHILGDSYGLRDSAINVQEYDRSFNNASFLGLGYPSRSHISGRMTYFSDFKHYRRQKLFYRGIPMTSTDEMRKYAVHHMACGIDTKNFAQLFGCSFLNVFKRELSELETAGVLKRDGSGLRLPFDSKADADVYLRVFYGERVISSLKRHYQSEYDPKENYEKVLQLRCGRNL